MTWFGSLDAEKWMSKTGVWTEEVRDGRLGRNLMGIHTELRAPER
jgi:hypothetical protein